MDVSLDKELNIPGKVLMSASGGGGSDEGKRG